MTAATKAALSSLAHRIAELDEEVAQLDARITPLLQAHAPELLLALSASASTRQPPCWSPPATTPNVCVRRRPGPTCAGSLRSRPPRARSARHRLNRGGDRQANRALWIIVISRLASDPETQAYMERRVKEGRTKREVIRMLKRYVAREVYRQLPRG